MFRKRITFWGDGIWIIWVSAGPIILFNLVRMIAKSPEPPFILPINPFQILCIAVATSSGVFLGLIISSMFSVMHYASATIESNKASIQKEAAYLESLLKKGRRFINDNTRRKLVRLTHICRMITVAHNESEDWENVLSGSVDSVEEEIDKVKSALNKLKGEIEEVSSRQDEEDDNFSTKINGRLSKINKTTKYMKQKVQVLSNLQIPMTNIHGIFYHIKNLLLIPELSKILRQNAMGVSIILGMALTFIILSSIQFASGGQLFDDSSRLIYAVALVWAASGNSILIFRAFSIYSNIIESVMGSRT